MNTTRADWERQKFRQLKKRLKNEWRAPKKPAEPAEPIYAREPDNDDTISDADYERVAEDAARIADAKEGFDD